MTAHKHTHQGHAPKHEALEDEEAKVIDPKTGKPVKAEPVKEPATPAKKVPKEDPRYPGK